MAHILIIEDDPEVRSIFKRWLEMHGHEVTEAGDGAAGVRVFRERPADLIVTDIVMPEKEGLETIKEIRRDHPDVRIIAVSGGGAMIADSTCLRLAEIMGANRTFTKPVDLAELKEAIAELTSEG